MLRTGCRRRQWNSASCYARFCCVARQITSPCGLRATTRRRQRRHMRFAHTPGSDSSFQFLFVLPATSSSSCVITVKLGVCVLWLQCLQTAKPVLIPRESVLHGTRPEHVVYQRLLQSHGVIYMSGVSVIEAEWLWEFFPDRCILSRTPETSKVTYDQNEGCMIAVQARAWGKIREIARRDQCLRLCVFCVIVKCYAKLCDLIDSCVILQCTCTRSFCSTGRRSWHFGNFSLPYRMEPDCYLRFAYYFLEGSVCSQLKPFVEKLLQRPSTLFEQNNPSCKLAYLHF